MGYQALLFCPDEKTARTVTQVLSELDFTVVPCTEPFAAVKKLMGEHFDAVVVDCDNEQNATLLFKSARNTVHNQSSLAVAVVEAGVAKAFRIGANLVLTKPINVEQAKGTLRVARGLLRKSEAAKPAAGAASAAIKPAAPVSATARPVVRSQVPSGAATSQTAPLVLATSASPKLPPRPQIVASVPASDESDVDLFEIDEEVSEEIPSASAKPAAPFSAPKITAAAAATEPKTVEATSKPAPVAGFGASAASAPAPAREPKPAVVTEPGASTTIAAHTSLVKDAERDSATDNSSGTATFTFGGNVGDNKSTSGGGKKAIIAVAAVVLIAAGYAAWSKFGPSSEAATIPARVATQKATTPSAAPMSPSSISSSPNPSANSAVQAPSTNTPAVKASGTAKANPDTRTVAGNENIPTRPGKDSGEANSSKPSPSATATDKAPETKEDAKPIVMKSATKAGAKTSIADATAPTLSAIDTAPNGTLPNLIGNQSKAPTPVLQTMSISQGVSQGLLVKKVQPPYPQNAMTMHIEGAVQLLATISKTGDISAVKVLSGEPQLARAAADAVKQWKYKPYLLNGSPVEIQTQVTINFKLPH